MSKLTEQELKTLSAIAKSARRSILEMVTNAQSGHPGGSLSCIDYLTLLYAKVLSKTGEKVVISNGHISPGVYSILAEMGYIPKGEVVKNFRKVGSVYEGHVTRHVKGIWFGTGPLGVGVSVASGFALAEKLKNSNQHVYALIGDGEAQEGQVYETINFANKYKLNNFTVFVDFNRVQLSASLEEIMPLDLVKIFKAANWNVIEGNGHDFNDLWKALQKAHKSTEKPTVIIGHTIMGKGVKFMEVEGENIKATWHGNAPKKEQTEAAIAEVTLSEEEKTLVENFRSKIKWHPENPNFTKSLTKVELNPGEPILYTLETLTDNRSAYGQALLDLAKHNPQILALTADLRGSVMTKFLASEYKERHIDVGIAEQHMVSLAGGLSLDGFIPFASTFGAFMSSRAKDQARVNDINQTNVKMVATHCGLSVGEDGPTHQAIDDSGSFLGMFNTMVIEPADPNQTDRIIRYIAGHYGNFYVRMGRHKYPILTKEDGSPYYGKDYVYEYGKTDVIRNGSQVTIAATGAMLVEALKAYEQLKNEGISAEVVAVSSIKHFDQTILDSLKKTGKVVTIEDHNVLSGLGSQLAKFICDQNLSTKIKSIGVKEYQLSGKAEELYKVAGLTSENLISTIKQLL